MKIFGGIHGILGGLLGILTFYAYFFVVTTGSNAVLDVLGAVAALTCIIASIAVLAGPGRRAGLCLLVAGLIDMFIGTLIIPLVGSLLMTPAVVGGVLAVIYGHAPPAALPPRHEW